MVKAIRKKGKAVDDNGTFFYSYSLIVRLPSPSDCLYAALGYVDLIELRITDSTESRERMVYDLISFNPLDYGD